MALCFDALALTLVLSRATWPQLHQPRLPAQLQYLMEQIGQGCQMVLAKVGDGAEVGSVVGCKHPEGDVLVESLGDAPGGGHPGAVAVEQHLDHHPGMVGRAASLLTLIAGSDGRQIQLVHHIGDEIGQMVLGQPLLAGRRQQQLLLRIRRDGRSCSSASFHAGGFSHHTPVTRFSRTRC